MNKHAANTLRIIGGKWRGRKLSFPSAAGLRPTHDRIRETLFNWLMHDIVGAHCLDLFAGSGALGFEALSRGAAAVTFIESQKVVCETLCDNVRLLNAANAHVIQGCYTQTHLSTPFDIVFLDPPFGHDLLQAAAQWLEQQNLLKSQAQIYVEVEKGALTSNLPENWHCSRHKSTSSLDYYLFSRNSV